MLFNVVYVARKKMARRYPAEAERYLPPADVAVPGDYIKMDAAWLLVERYRERGGWPVRFLRPCAKSALHLVCNLARLMLLMVIRKPKL